MIITMYADVRDNSGFEVEVTIEDFVTLLIAPPVERERRHKALGQCFSTARYAGTRGIENAVEASAIALDIDNGWPVEAALCQFDDLDTPYVLYTTTKSRPEHHRYRIVLFLNRPVDAQSYGDLWAALGRRFAPFGCAIDPQTRDISRLSILPYRWTGDDDRGSTYAEEHHIAIGRSTGQPIDVDAMLRAYPAPPAAPAPSRPRPIYNSLTEARKRLRRMRNANADRSDLTDLYNSPVIPQRTLDDMLTAPAGGRTFKLLCSAAATALDLGFGIDEVELVEIAEAFAQRVGKRASRKQHWADARNALRWAEGQVL